jgi:hypothetical protein
MPDFGTIITVAYQEILGRPADPGGLAHYNARMNEGLSEEAMRETLLRSPEYAARFPGPGPMSPLRIVGNRFHNAAGEVKLLGMIVCCDDPATPEDEALARGWPLVDEPTLDLMAAHQVNYTDVRLGPSINREVWGAGEGPQFVGYAAVEDGRYDLDRWNPAFWQRVRSVIAHARSRGIYVGMSIIDFWVLDHELSPWQADRNIQGFDGGRLEVGRSTPHRIHEQWVRKVVAETGEFPNVLYQDGNESFKGAFPVWVHRLRDIVREELSSRGFGRRPFGTNSGRTEEVDHLYLHSRTAPEPGPLPIIVNEYPDRSPNQVLIEAWRAYGTGVYYQYWRGEHSWADTQRVLDGLQVIVEGGNPVEFPDDCPWLVGWVPRVHNVLDGGHGQLDPPIPIEGGFVVFDSTPRFSRNPDDDRGRPCNDEHPEACGGRPCEDPRGGRWTMVGGSAPIRVLSPGPDSGYQLRVGPIPAPGTYTVRVEALPDAHDALGLRLRVSPTHAREASFTVGIEADMRATLEE